MNCEQRQKWVRSIIRDRCTDGCDKETQEGIEAMASTNFICPGAKDLRPIASLRKNAKVGVEAKKAAVEAKKAKLDALVSEKSKLGATPNNHAETTHDSFSLGSSGPLHSLAQPKKTRVSKLCCLTSFVSRRKPG